jgi:hypothetical protein
MSKKVLVTLTDEQYEKLNKSADLGGSDAEKLRNAFLIYDNLKDLMDVIRVLRQK